MSVGVSRRPLMYGAFLLGGAPYLRRIWAAGISAESHNFARESQRVLTIPPVSSGVGDGQRQSGRISRSLGDGRRGAVEHGLDGKARLDARHARDPREHVEHE